MVLSDHIHWSFQYDGRSQTPHFGKQLMEILNRGTSAHALSQTARASEKKYTVLPNYWKGYKGRAGEEAARDLTIGEVIINRKREPSKNWYYDIQFLNTTSGENLHLDFYTADDDFRTLRDTWRVTATNGAGDQYRQFACEGHITSQGDQQQVSLVVNNTNLPVGHFESSHPITCNWTLFDAIPNLAHQLKASGEQISFVILEDLEKIRTPVRIGYMEDWTLPLGDRTLKLSGFFVYGSGTLPSYWWLDQREQVIIASTTFQTFVLSGGAA